LNPNSEEYYSPEFAEQVVNELLLPLENVVNIAGPAASGDLDLSGTVTVNDFLEFLERYGDAVIPNTPDGVPPNQFVLPSSTLGVLNLLTGNQGFVTSFDQTDFQTSTFNVPPAPFGALG
jgi:hypothetical protein